MKTFLKSYLVLLFALTCHFYTLSAQENALSSLANTKWTVTLLEILDKGDSLATNKISQKTFEQGKNVIAFGADGKYRSAAFLGVQGMEGAYIQEGKTLVLSDPAIRAYYWVFHIEELSKQTLKIVFVSYKNENKREVLTLQPYQENATSTGTADNPAQANISYEKINGTWEWATSDSKKLTISLLQSGSSIIGWHTYGKEGESHYEISGTIKGDVANLELKKPTENNPIQLARLKLNKDENGTTLLWELILEDGKPTQVNTQDRVSLKRVGEYKDPNKL
ncbi:hypothetical protein [Hugenholtzia roseola]|uniref:hypothetical protein n=1 Tax=Hugenholtzia roseola TaxID=1002 RepID=UPI0003FB21E8|nr:hypothetical protein [Hugenholtzia roseola]